MLSILQNEELMKKILNYIDICHDQIIKTKDQLIRSTSSCRMWQFKYMLLNVFDRLNNNIITKNIDRLIENPSIFIKICNIMDSFLSDINKKNILYQIIVYNRNLNIYPINDIIELENDGNEIQNYCMCIYNPEIDIGSIIHFFTIIRKKNIYYINSSYGSDNVCVPQYTKRLNKLEFNNFCKDLPNKDIAINNFYQKYFLEGNLKMRYNNNLIENVDPSLKSKWIEPSNGINREIQLLLQSNSEFKVGLILNYEEYLEDFLVS